MFSPFILQARLQQGIALDSRIGIALDSLLASNIRSAQKKEQGISGQELDGGAIYNNKVKTVELPLKKCENNDGKWHWVSSTAQPMDNNDNPIALNTTPDVHTIMRSADIRRFESQTTRLPRVLSTKSGRWKAWKIPVPIIPAAYLQWTGIGNLDKIISLAEEAPSLGQRRKTGEGTVVEWNIEQCSLKNMGHLHSDGTLGRPVFDTCLESMEIPKNEVRHELVGVRPPYWHIGNQELAYF